MSDTRNHEVIKEYILKNEKIIFEQKNHEKCVYITMIKIIRQKPHEYVCTTLREYRVCSCPEKSILIWQNKYCGYKAYHLLLAVKVWNLTGRNCPINWLFNIAKETNLHLLHKALFLERFGLKK